jgi:spore coat polysaccharide biosynthesis protein SpsF (cytidylyltransferase family)
LELSEQIDQLLVATGPGPENDIIRDEALLFGVDCPYIETPEDDVLRRFTVAALAYRPDVIVRITGDCPLIDAGVVDQTIQALDNADFASNVVNRTFPRGLDCEVMQFDTLMKLNRLVKGDQREHVCSYVYNSDRFDVVSVEDDEDNSGLTWCVDDQDDFDSVKKALKWGVLPYKEVLDRWLKTC